MNMQSKKGWADRLKAGSEVIVQPAEGNPRVATVDRVTATVVVVEGRRYRRGKGRSALMSYANEGYDVETILQDDCGRIFPANAANRTTLQRLAISDAVTIEVDRLTGEIRRATKAAADNRDVATLQRGLDALTS